MRNDHRPARLKRWHQRLETRWVEHFIAPQLDALGPYPMIMKPWNFFPHGPNISAGEALHVVTSRDRPVRLTVWRHNDGAEERSGGIRLGSYVLLCPGVRIDSAVGVEIADNCMLAAGCYLTDADWHDQYDRTKPIGAHASIVLEDNVWLGDGVVVCKGVSIGRNSIIGTGSVVTHDIPANAIAAGNPAKVLKALDDEQTLVRRVDLLADGAQLSRTILELDRYMLSNNRWRDWLRILTHPRRGD